MGGQGITARNRSHSEVSGYLNLRGDIQPARLPRRLSGKESACQAGDAGSFPELGRSPGGGNSNPLQYSCPGSPMDKAWWALVHGVAKELDTTG